MLGRFRPFIIALTASAVIFSSASSLRAQDPAPGPGAWQLGPGMAAGRYAPTATLLPSGKVLVAGGYNGTSCITSMQLFDPATNAWTPAPSLSTGRDFATATLLNTGSVLIAGGYSTYYGSLSSVQLYNPSSNAFVRVKYGMTTPRELFTATLLSNGNVFLAGGYRTGYGTLASAEIYNASTGAFSRTGSMQTPYGRFGHDAVPIPGTTKILVVGGKEQTPGGWHPLATAELYDTATGAFSPTGSMAYRRDRCRAVWVPFAGKILVTGGKGEAVSAYVSGDGGDVLPCEWYDPASGQFTPGPSLTNGRMAHTLTVLNDNSILVAGGYGTSFGGTTTTAERSNFLTNVWQPAASMTDSGHDQAAVMLKDGRVLKVGGKRVLPGGAVDYPTTSELYTP